MYFTDVEISAHTALEREMLSIPSITVSAALLCYSVLYHPAQTFPHPGCLHLPTGAEPEESRLLQVTLGFHSDYLNAIVLSIRTSFTFISNYNISSGFYSNHL